MGNKSSALRQSWIHSWINGLLGYLQSKSVIKPTLASMGLSCMGPCHHVMPCTILRLCGTPNSKRTLTKYFSIPTAIEKIIFLYKIPSLKYSIRAVEKTDTVEHIHITSTLINKQNITSTQNLPGFPSSHAPWGLQDTLSSFPVS